MDGGDHNVEVRLLGPPEVVVGGRVVEIGSAKQLGLLVALALDAGVAVSTERLVDVLWGEDPPGSAHSTLRGLVYRLRKSLAGNGEEVAPWLRGKGSGYVADLAPDQVDAARFEQLAATGRDALARADAAAAADAFQEALVLWRGPALDGLPGGSYLVAEARRLDDSRLGADEDLAEAELRLGRPGDALVRLEPHVAAHPLRERAWGQLMLALYRLGRQADALRAYQAVRRVLADELGVEPTPALRDLEARILQHRPDLMLNSPAAPIRIAAPVRPPEPGDTVAFLFTDIESSTRRWEDDSAAMAADLARHDQLLAEACGSWGGSVFSHTGDGLCAAFPTAAAAIGAAVAGQVALAGQRWEGDRLRVRMAIHAGPVERRAGNYFGPTLNRAARLLGSAWGRQIVCSAAAADLAADQLPDQVSLIDLGEQRLADLARPERVLQVALPGLPADFPPLRTASAPRHNLPAALTSFIGRSGELHEIAAHLVRSRLVTLLGPGGAGKTRLSLETAAAAAERFPDGAWLVELAPVRDPSLLAHAVAAALGLDPGVVGASGRPADESLADHLLHRHLLIVLDNCEHVVASAARLAHAILTRCPDVSILATSREILAVPGETIVRVASLSLPSEGNDDDALGGRSDAVTLFCERARESAGGFALTEANAAAVVRICRRLDGIPLALELAAARMRVLGAEALADRLDDRFRILGDGPRTVDPRHQTLQAAVDWSHDLLSDAERIVLRRLAVFPSDFSVEAAEAVTAGGEGIEGPEAFEVLGIVGRLADKSLLNATADNAAEVRYRLLETVRQYAAGTLADAGETAAIHRRHRDFFSPGPGWTDPGADAQEMRWAHTEADNLRAALEWSREHDDGEAILRLAATQAWYWLLACTPGAGEWLELATAAPDSGNLPLRVRARVGLALVLQNEGRDEGGRSVALAREALVLAVEADDQVSASWARLQLSLLMANQGHLPEAETICAEAIDAFRTRAELIGEATAHGLQGGFSLSRGDLGEARHRFGQALALFGADSDNYMLIHILGMLALLDAVDGDADQAQRNAAQAIHAARRFPGRQVLVMTLTRSAEAAVISGRVNDVRTPLDELLGLLRDLASQRWVAEALELTAIVLATADPEAAAIILGAAVALRGSLREEPGFLAVLAEHLANCRAQVTALLGAGAADEHERAGATMHLDQILAYARVRLRTGAETLQ